MELSERQTGLLRYLAEGDGARTTDLIDALGIPLADFGPTTEPLLADGLVGTTVPTLGPGWWWITPKGRGTLRP